MAKPKRSGKKYDSFDDKILDYHKRMLLWTINHPKETSGEKFDQEYNALTKARNDIKNRIKENLDSAFFFSSIPQWACYPNITEHNKILNFNNIALTDEFTRLASESNLLEYPKQLNKYNNVREKIENQNRDFTSDIFSEENLRKIFEIIFYGYYKKPSSIEDEEYKLDIAFLMIKEASRYLSNRYLSYPETQFLSQEFVKAENIGHLIKNLVSGKSAFTS